MNVTERSGSATRTAARAGARLTRKGWRRMRAATHAGGAGQTGLAHLVELHGVHSAGDAAFTVALAGILFFSPTDPGTAKSRVALYLLLTIAPFAVVSPVIGPVLDRFRHGRRYAIAATLFGRAWLAWLVSHAIARHDVALSLYPEAFAVLVLSKAYNVARSAATPRLLPEGMSLVSANARQSLAGLVTASVAGGMAGVIAHLTDASWAVKLAVVIYLAAAVLAWRLPKNVDSAAGERGLAPPSGARHSWRRLLHVGRLEPSVRTALRAQAALRALAGFLTLYLAFLIRTGHLHGLRQGVALSLLVIAAGAGGLVGTVLGARLPYRRPETLLLVTVGVTTVACIVTAVLFGVVSALAMAFVGNFAQTLGKLALDSIVQRDVDEAVRTSTFARSETVNQLGWVVGGAVGIALPLGGTWGFGIAAIWLVAAFVVTLRAARDDRAGGPTGPPAEPSTVPAGGAGRVA